ncbi:MAG: hypothetical protein AAGC68_13260 [Verrucomicrobiota bacterium]
MAQSEVRFRRERTKLTLTAPVRRGARPSTCAAAGIPTFVGVALVASIVVKIIETGATRQSRLQFLVRLRRERQRLVFTGTVLIDSIK